ncbi:MAG TPA: FAD-dependent oxidoreductase, partial [bacterium]
RLKVSEPFQVLDPLYLSWLIPGGKKVSLRCASLPAPFHLAWGLLRSDAFSFKEKLSLARAVSIFSKKPFKFNPSLRTVAQFLDATHQGPGARERFWIPLTNAVLNVPVTIAPLQGLGEVLCRIFFGNRRDSALMFATKPLSELAFPEVSGFLAEKGGQVHFHEGIQSFTIPEGSFELKSRSGKNFMGDALVWAVPPSSLSALWPKDTWSASESFGKMGKSPIVSVHLILSKEVVEEQMVGLSGAKFDWVFNRNANWGWNGKGQYLSFTASAAAVLALLKDPELVDLALRELSERCLQAKDLSVLHSKVTREMAATFSWTQETDPLRPRCETPYANIFLAGDWTATGLPATIEGACLSGHRAAEKVTEYLLKNT